MSGSSSVPVASAYLDHAADTPVRPEALEAMVPWLGGGSAGNPTGTHRAARAARRAVDDAREEVATLIGCTPGEVVLTSGGTEADDLAVHGLGIGERSVVVCSAVEHAAVARPVAALGGRTCDVDADGVVDLEALARLLDETDGVRLVSVMAANNETGVLQPVADVVEVVRRHAPGSVVHTDAVQAAPWEDPSTVDGADAVSVSAHKLGGPGGVGALIVRHGTPLAPRLLGGGQERGRRAGSHNVAGVVGFGAAARAVVAERSRSAPRISRLAGRLLAGLVAVDGIEPTVAGQVPRLPSIVHVLVAGVAADELLFLLDEQGVAAAGGSSCASGALEPSPVLAAMGTGAGRAALRLSLGWCTTPTDVEVAIEAVRSAVTRLRDDLPGGEDGDADRASGRAVPGAAGRTRGVA